MKKTLFATALLAVIAVSAPAFVGSAYADEVKMVGVINKITMAPDGKSAVAVLKDNKTGKEVSIFIDDDLTLDKFKDHRIVEGDEIRTKYNEEDGKNHSALFKKTAGC